MQTEKPFYVYVHRYASGPKEGQVFYVGKGSDDRVKRKNGRNPHWENVVNKYGYEFEILMNFAQEKCAFTFEKIAINQYGFDNLANMTLGGEGASGLSSGNSRKVYCSNGMVFDSAHEAARWLNRTYAFSGICAVCSGDRKVAYGFSWSYDNRPKHPSSTGYGIAPRKVYCSNGMTFNSVKDAGEWADIRESCIAKACVGDVAHSAGRAWSYNYYPSKPQLRDKHKTVYCSNGMIFNCAKEASDWSGVGSTGIVSACNGIFMQYGGYAWSFEHTPPKPRVVHSKLPIKRSDGICFNNSKDAAENIGPKAHPGAIAGAARGIRESAYGYTWEFI